MLQGMGVDDTLSNLTSAISNEASISSSTNINEMGTIPQQHLQSFVSTNNQTQPAPKKRRNLPGNPGTIPFVYLPSLLTALLAIKDISAAKSTFMSHFCKQLISLIRP